MAKHFKVVPDETTEVLEVPQRQTVWTGFPSAEDTQGYLPYGQVASYRSSYADAAPTGEYFIDEMPARGGIHAVGRGILLLMAWTLRLFAYGCVLLVVLNVLSLSLIRTQLTSITDAVTSNLPWHTFSTLSLDTPFGGTFRVDLAIIAVLLFVLDWALCRVRADLR
ncbi:MAG: hypothetical protein UHS51_01440 [Atopobiaceae bacterium]|nr:hypothetical protein [Atopobiaceae bacterium]